MTTTRLKLLQLFSQMYLKIPLLLLLMLWIRTGSGDTEFSDIVISDTRTFSLDKSPYIIRDDILIESSGKLEIEAGVEVKFGPEVGITVRGILKAMGTPNKKIRFTAERFLVEQQPNRTIRLVDGPTVEEGIIQVLDLGSWRSVCTNSRNWTAVDMGVACRQLGFTGGEWHHWYPHLNDTRQMLYQEPGKKANLGSSCFMT